jgi:hypothetical protein
MKFKTAGFTFLAFLAGLIIGAVANMAFSTSKIAKMMFCLQDVELSQFGAFATQAYLNESPEVGIWDLTNHIKEVNRVLKERDNPNAYLFVPLQQYLMEDHVRLALLYEKMGDNLRRQDNIEKALECYRSAHHNREITEEKLIQVVLELDKDSEPLE